MTGVVDMSVRACQRGGVATAVIVTTGSAVEAGTTECTILHVRTRLL
jgi:hypothetical protein